LHGEAMNPVSRHKQMMKGKYLGSDGKHYPVDVERTAQGL
jgi:hypothetical protein